MGPNVGESVASCAIAHNSWSLFEVRIELAFVWFEVFASFQAEQVRKVAGDLFVSAQWKNIWRFCVVADDDDLSREKLSLNASPCIIVPRKSSMGTFIIREKSERMKKFFYYSFAWLSIVIFANVVYNRLRCIKGSIVKIKIDVNLKSKSFDAATFEFIRSFCNQLLGMARLHHQQYGVLKDCRFDWFSDSKPD